MTLTYPRLLVFVALAAVAEFAAFEWRYQDLIFLARPTQALALAPPETMARYVRTALARPRLTRTSLERLVTIAAAREDHATAIAALQRIVESTPRDLHVRLRLADVLRQDGRLDDARRHYQDVIAQSGAAE